MRVGYGMTTSRCIALMWFACLLVLNLLENHMTPEQMKLFYQILETKNSWGKNEIRTVLLEVASGIRTSI